MNRPNKEEYESMTEEQRNNWYLQILEMHQTMWGFNPHGAEYFDSEKILETINQAADFFGLPMPKVTEAEDTVAKIKTNEEAKNTGISLSSIEAQMQQNLQDLNLTQPAYCKLSAIEIHEKEFEKTPKKSIKRYMYK